MMMSGPSFDAARLADLVDELDGDHAAARQFVDQFVDMLPQRIARVTAAVRGDDRTQLADALQGLRASAEMVGACGLARLAGRAYAQRRAGHVIDAAVLAASLQCEAARAQEAMRRVISTWP